jgi:xanthine dehydrogenase YagR molybdenum-binding subunit
MKFEQPAGTNPIDQQRVVGQPIDRIDGPLKTTGRAGYAYERHDVAPDQAYGVVVGAAIAKRRIVALDTRAAKATPGVIGVVTAANAGKVGVGEFYSAHPLAGPDIQHYHQAIAVVVARHSSRRLPPLRWCGRITTERPGPMTWPPILHGVRRPKCRRTWS